MTQRVELFFFFNLTQRIVCFLKMTQRVEPLFEYDSENWTSFLSMTQRIEPPFLSMTQRIFLKMTQRNGPIRKKWSKNWAAFYYDSKNWIFFKTQTNEFLSMTHRIEPLFFELFQDDSKSWSLFSICLKELNPFFSKCLKELNLSFIWTTSLHDSMNWTFSQFDSKSSAFFLIWLIEVNLPFWI